MFINSIHRAPLQLHVGTLVSGLSCCAIILLQSMPHACLFLAEVFADVDDNLKHFTGFSVSVSGFQIGVAAQIML